MAILQGFPPSNTISPSVRITEKDLSYILPEQSFHRAGLIGFASKGPVNLPIIITSTRQLTKIFGNPHPDESDPYLIYAAKQYLLVATELFVVRVADEDPVSDEQALTASITVPAAGSLIQVESNYAGPYDFNADSFFRWRLNGVLSPNTLLVTEGSGKTTEEVVDELNAQIDLEVDGIEFYVSDIDSLGVRTLWAYGPDSSLEFVSVQNSIYGGAFNNTNPTGLATGMTRGRITGTASKYPNNGYTSAGHYDLTGLTGLTLQVVIDGTDNVLIDGVVQVISLADLQGQDNLIADVVTAINAQRESEGGTLPGGWECSVASTNYLRFETLHYGREARIRVKPDSTAETIFGLRTDTQTGATPSGSAGDVGAPSYGIITGEANTDDEVTFTVYADSPGLEGNQTRVNIFNDIRENHFVIEVMNNGVVVESWGPLTKNQASSYYVSTYISLVSDYIKVSDNTDNGAGPLNGTYYLSGGTDGIPADPDLQDALLIGNQVGATGIYTLGDPEQVDIDLIAIPGHCSTSVVMALLDFCQNTRQDCLAIIDPPFGLTVSEIVAWQNGSHPLNLTRFNSDFGALYWPWVKITDTFNRVDMWCPPSGSIMAVIARSDFLAKPWFAPAGINRGIVPGITDVYQRPSLEERDLMYGNYNCVNPIVQFNDVDGFVVWGQKTLQRRPTALNRVNVRRCMFYLEKKIKAAVKTLLFDPNDDIFASKFIGIVNGILYEVKSGRGLYDYIIKADSELNTPDVIDRNEFRAQIGVQPTRAVEFMFIEFSIHRTGTFAESSF
jgi:phage tail sheath protein FI